MTIAARNRFLRAALAMAAILLAGAAVAVIAVLTGDYLPAEAPGTRPLPFLGSLPLFRYSPVASVLAVAAFPLFAAASLAFILFAFEKTQTVELTFFAAAAFAVALESLRLVMPLRDLWVGSMVYSVSISRVALFARLMALLSILGGIIFATAENSQQTGAGVFILSFFSFSLAKAIPMNTSDLAANFYVRSGYPRAMETFLAIVGILSVAAFLLQGIRRGIPEYRRSAAGLAVFLAGYGLLLSCDAWAIFAAGTALFFGGARMFLRGLHSYYLWQ